MIITANEIRGQKPMIGDYMAKLTGFAKIQNFKCSLVFFNEESSKWTK